MEEINTSKSYIFGANQELSAFSGENIHKTIDFVNDNKHYFIKKHTITKEIPATGWEDDNTIPILNFLDVEYNATMDVIIAPAPEDFEQFVEAGIRCISIDGKNATLKRSQSFDNPIDCNILIFESINPPPSS